MWIHGRPSRGLYEVSASMTLTVTSDLRSLIWHWSLIFPIGRVLLALNPKMLVFVALNLWAGIDRCSMTCLGIILSVEPGSTWMRVISIEPMYPVKYNDRPCFP